MFSACCFGRAQPLSCCPQETSLSQDLNWESTYMQQAGNASTHVDALQLELHLFTTTIPATQLIPKLLPTPITAEGPLQTLSDILFPSLPD